MTAINNPTSWPLPAKEMLGRLTFWPSGKTQAQKIENNQNSRKKLKFFPYVGHDEKMAKNWPDPRAPKVVNEGLVSHVSKDKFGHSSEHTWR